MNTQNLVKNMLGAIQRSEVVHDLGERLELRTNELRTKDVITKKQEDEILKAAAFKRQQIYKERRLECISTINKLDNLESIKKLFRRVSGEDDRDRALLHPNSDFFKKTISNFLDKKNMDLYRAGVNARLEELKSPEIV